MTCQRFEDLPVWKSDAELYEATEDLLASPEFPVTRAFRDQLDRAALSVSNNIAEGFERGTTNELLQFIYIARGSAGEVRSMLTLKLLRSQQSTSPAHLKSQSSNLISLAESCSRQLRAWADSLQNSEIQGPRHLNEKTRRIHDQQKRAENCRKDLLRKLPRTTPSAKKRRNADHLKSPN